MPRRNFIFLIIVLILILAGVFGFLYFGGYNNRVIENIPGINFLSQFNPFGSNPGTGVVGENPGEEGGDGEIPTEEELAAVKLKKVSNMPVAGFTVFLKERYKDLPPPSEEEVEEVPPAPVVPENTEVSNEQTRETTTPTTTPVKPPVVKKVVNNNPVSPPTEFVEALRYVERSTGNIYQTFADKIEERRFSGTVIPKIYDAYFGNEGQSVVMRHLKPNNTTIETFSGVLPKEKLGEDLPSNDLTGSFLVDDIKDISLSPDTNKIFYLLNIGQSTVGTILNILDGKKVQVFDSVFTEWNSFWPNNKIITMTTKPSGSVLGYMYMIDVDKKNFTKVLGDVNGLTTLMSPNGKLVLVGNNSLSLFVYNLETKGYQKLGLDTLPEKCVWNKTSESIYCAVPVFIEGANYPDDWYRGEVSFSDQIWKINISSGSSSLLVDPILVIGGEDVDGIKLALDVNEKYLFFVNKKDSFLWELELN